MPVAKCLARADVFQQGCQTGVVIAGTGDRVGEDLGDAGGFQCGVLLVESLIHRGHTAVPDPASAQ